MFLPYYQDSTEVVESNATFWSIVLLCLLILIRFKNTNALILAVLTVFVLLCLQMDLQMDLQIGRLKYEFILSVVVLVFLIYDIINTNKRTMNLPL